MEISAALPKLEILTLYQNQLTDAAFLEQTPALVELNVSENALEVLHLPDALDDLRELHVQSMPSLQQLSLPQAMPELERLRISGNALSELTLPKGMNALFELSLEGNRLATLTFPGGLGNLRNLNLWNNPFRELTLHPEMIEVTSLRLSNLAGPNFVLQGASDHLQRIDGRESLLSELSISGVFPQLRTVWFRESPMAALHLQPHLPEDAEYWFFNAGPSTASQMAIEGLPITGWRAPPAPFNTDVRSEVLSPAESQIRLRWPSTQGRRYVIQRSGDLMQWETLANAIPAQEGHTSSWSWNWSSTDPELRSSSSYFRVREAYLYEDDFEGESTASDWRVSTPSGGAGWELGTPEIPALSGAFNGGAAWGVRLKGDYGSGTETVLRSPLLDLEQAPDDDVVLSFHYYCDTPNIEDAGKLKLADLFGRTLFEVFPMFSGTTQGWTFYRTLIPAHVADGRFVVELSFTSNADADVGAGWYIDNLVIFAQPRPVFDWLEGDF